MGVMSTWSLKHPRGSHIFERMILTILLAYDMRRRDFMIPNQSYKLLFTTMNFRIRGEVGRSDETEQAESKSSLAKIQ
jgi:hypothetical protein